MSIYDGEFTSIFKWERTDEVGYHIGQMFVARSANDPIFNTQENVLSSLNIILNCVHFAAKRIICACSGGAVYREQQYLLVSEKYSMNPLSQGTAQCLSQLPGPPT